MVEELWYSNLFLIDHYLVISCGLLWYIKFLIPTSINNKHRSKLSTLYREFCFKIPKGIRLTAIIISLIIILTSIIVSSLEPFSRSSPVVLGLQEDNSTDIKIGALLGLSGISAQRGESQKVALEMAEKDINSNLSSAHENIRVKLFLEDTQRNPIIALEKTQKISKRGY